MKRLGLLLAVTMCLSSGCAERPASSPTLESVAAVRVLRLAVTTSTRDTGLLDVLVPVFEEQQGARVDVIAVGTGAALKLGEAGDVDAVLVHAREAEDAFMAAGHGSRREDVMFNTFEIVGPESDPAGVRGLEPGKALMKFAKAGARFVSRGDESGTHKREQRLWAAAGGRPDWDGYIESGQGMGATLTMSDQMEAYTLADRGTYLKLRSKVALFPLVADAESLRNSYGIMVVNRERHDAVDDQLANAFVDFLIAPQTQRLIGEYTIDGERLFHPLHSPEASEAAR